MNFFLFTAKVQQKVLLFLMGLAWQRATGKWNGGLRRTVAPFSN